MEHEPVGLEMMEEHSTASPSSESWYSMLQGKLSHVDPWAFDLLVCGIVAFVVGFVSKNFGKLLLLGLLLAGVLAYAVQLGGYYEIPWADIQAWLGFGQVSSWAEGVDTVVAWIKAHPAGAVSGLLGFMIGWKVG